MTDIVERLRSLNADFLHEEAADEIERLRAALLKAEMEVEIASVEIIGRAVDIGHRRGIRAALKVCDERMHDYRTGTPTDGTIAAIEEISDLIGHIRALLEDGR